MSDLATVHLKQGRSFLRAGDAPRAVELLEKARVLSRTNKDLHRQVLEELASACDAAGLGPEAARWRKQANQLWSTDVATAGMANPYNQPVSPTRASGGQSGPRGLLWAIMIVAIALIVIFAGIAVFALARHTH